MEIKIVPGYAFLEEVRGLFVEYTDMLVEVDHAFSGYLTSQGYSRELENVGEKYSLPEGRLYLALVDNEPAACIALRKMDNENCEMKRLYVRPAYRKHGLAGQLVRKIIADAKELGYSSILMDTHRRLEDAIRLYKDKFGFQEIDCYYDNPIDNTFCMKLDLASYKEKERVLEDNC